MGRFNFSDNIQVSGRSLHLQTNNYEEEKKIVSTLFDGGRVLAKDELEYELSNIKKLDEYVKQLHTEKMASIELLYTISARVKTVRHPTSLNRLGCQFLKWGLLDEAISELTMAIQYDPNFGEVYLNLGTAYLRRGSVEEALKVFHEGAQRFPKYADMCLKLGFAYLKHKQYREAVIHFRKALKTNSSYDEAHFYMALGFTEILNHKEFGDGIPDKEDCTNLAKKHLSRAVALSTRFRTPEVEEIMRKLHKGNYDSASQLFEKVGSNIPKILDLDFVDEFYLNFMYGEKGKNEKLVHDFIKKLELLVKRHPKFGDIKTHLGIGYLVQCRELFINALQQFRSAVEIDPNHKKAETYLKLAENEGKGFLILLRALLK
jgi:tetratricopeptide (TPR) repeat protein